MIINRQRYKTNRRFFFLMKLKSMENSQWIGWNTKNLKLYSRKFGTARKLNYLFPLAFSGVAESIGIHNLAFSEGEDKASKAGIQNHIWYFQRLHDYLLLNYFMWRRIQNLLLHGSWNREAITMVGRISYRAWYLSPATDGFCHHWKQDIRLDELWHGSRVIKLLWVRQAANVSQRIAGGKKQIQNQIQSNLNTNQFPGLNGIFGSQRFILKHEIDDL